MCSSDLPCGGHVGIGAPVKIRIERGRHQSKSEILGGQAGHAGLPVKAEGCVQQMVEGINCSVRVLPRGPRGHTAPCVTHADILPEHRPAASPPSNRAAYLVLGMHRSGTSAMTQVLALAGATLPENVMPGDEHNAKGYFEPWRIAVFNDQRLRAAGGA